MSSGERYCGPGADTRRLQRGCWSTYHVMMLALSGSFPALGLPGLFPSLSGTIEEAVTTHLDALNNVNSVRNLFYTVISIQSLR